MMLMFASKNEDEPMRRPLSIENYQVQLELVMNEPDAHEHFVKYLKRSLNLEGYLFLCQVKELQSPQMRDAQKAELVCSIYRDFIRLKSTHELNIDNHAREKVESVILETDQLSNSRELLVSQNVFAPVAHIVARELKEDAFPRYIRSEDFLEFIKTTGEDYLRLIAMDASLNGKQELVFRTSDFEATNITDKDICFVLRMNEDSTDWSPLRRTKKKDTKERDTYSYISKSSYHVADSIDGLHLNLLVYFRTLLNK
jgi:hypothetical protein